MIKEAGVLDTMGRLAAAAVLIKMIDSSKSKVDTQIAMGRVEAELARRREAQQMRPSMDGYGHGPHLFVPAGGAVPPEDAALRYQMGFIPNVPVGMDSGMTRLASYLGEDLGEKLAAASPGFFGRAANSVKSIFRPGAPIKPAAPLSTPKGPAKTLFAAPGHVSPEAAAAPAKTLMGPVPSAPLANPLVPPAPKNTYEPTGSLTGPAGFKKKVDPAANTTTAGPAVTEPLKTEVKPGQPPAPADKPINFKRLALGVGLGGAGAMALTKGTNAAIGYLNEEPATTQWGQQQFGGPRLAYGVNQYGQAQPSLPFAR